MRRQQALEGGWPQPPENLRSGNGATREIEYDYEDDDEDEDEDDPWGKVVPRRRSGP